MRNDGHSVINSCRACSDISNSGAILSFDVVYAGSAVIIMLQRNSVNKEKLRDHKG